ncbi:hypothetical protein [Helicobacter sp. 23-1045]
MRNYSEIKNKIKVDSAILLQFAESSAKNAESIADSANGENFAESTAKSAESQINPASFKKIDGK